MSAKGKGIPKSKDYALITLEENNAQQIRTDNLIQRVWNTTAFIVDAEDALRKDDQEYRDAEEWRTYISCDTTPKPFEPEAIRNLFFKTAFFEDEDIELTINWMLGSNERSVLCQDIDAVNLTKRFLKEARINFGHKYNVRVNKTMEIARKVQDFLENPIINLSERMMADVNEMKFLAYSKINHFIDNLTYRILCSEDAYMDEIDVTTAEYFYAAEDFDLHLWTLKNVPIYLDPVDTAQKKVNLYQIKTILTMPFSVISANMVIRGLHCHFDHYSAYARYYNLPNEEKQEKNLKVALQNEWQIHKQIQATVRTMLIKQRADYEELMRLKAEEEEAKARLRKKEEKQGGPKPDKAAKPKKAPKEPLIVTPDVVPVVRADFLEQDKLEYDQSILKYHPDTFGLTNGEINLRKFQILGGVYQLNCLSKPKMTNFPKLIMAWYKASKEMGSESIQINYDPQKTTDIIKFFKITFELPECYCYWGEPIPCLFEEGPANIDKLAEQNEKRNALAVTSPVIINDFNLHQLFTKPLMYSFIETVLPRAISTFKFPEDMFDEDEDKKAKATLGRTKQTAEELERERELMMLKQMLSFDIQSAPERLFPLFKRVLPVVILSTSDESTDKRKQNPYDCFSEFFSTLEAIKQSYRTSTFRDNLGKPLKILAEKYERNIRRPAMDIKIVAEGRKSEMDKVSLSASNTNMNKPSDEMTSTLKHATAQKKKGAKLRVSKTATKSIFEDVEEEIEEEVTGPKWSTANILNTEFDAVHRKVTIWTDRLGTFGFAYYRYQHFPFQSWSMQPYEENPNEVELTIESIYAVFRIYVSSDGYRASVTDFTKFYKSRKVYMEIKEPVRNIKILKEQLREKFLNIFPERDATWYMTGYFSEKHYAAECHTYNCLSLYSTSLKFLCSFWNKLSNRRTMVIKFGELRDLEDDLFLLRITPEDVMFVEIKEVCTDLETIHLEYTPTWRNLELYPDVNQLIISTFVGASDMRSQDLKMICYLKNLLQAIRPLSCS